MLTSRWRCRTWLAYGVMMVLVFLPDTEGCVCLSSHPQEHYCSAHFVALVKIKKEGKSDGMAPSYQIRLKKEFKMSEKARQALSHGLIWTPAGDDVCGVKFNNTKYLITGRVIGEKAWVWRCNFVQQWSTLSRKQRKGFRKLYHQGCQCKVRMPRPFRSSRERYCLWDTADEGVDDCQSLYTMCVPNHRENKGCIWSRNRRYRKCMKDRQKKKELEREREP